MDCQQIGDCRLYCGDCYDLLPELQADALITDPPYDSKFHYLGSKRRRSSLAQSRYPAQGKGDHWRTKVVGVDRPFDPRPWLHFPQIILWGAQYYAADLPCSTAWLLWDKREGTASDDHGDGEMAWTNLDGPLRIHRQLWRGVVRRGEENPAKSGYKLHPMQKPVALLRWCVQKTTGTVLDPFAGSFTTALACVELGRACIAIEIDSYYWELGCRRIEQAYSQPMLLSVASSSPVQEPFL